jgi:hypothetical protein
LRSFFASEDHHCDSNPRVLIVSPTSVPLLSQSRRYRRPCSAIGCVVRLPLRCCHRIHRSAGNARPLRCLRSPQSPLNRTGNNRGGSQVSQTAARGRNRLAEFTGESLPAPLPPLAATSLDSPEPICESCRAYRRGRDVPPAAKGDSSRSARPGFNAARMFRSAALATPLNVDRSLRSLRPHGGCG